MNGSSNLDLKFFLLNAEVSVLIYDCSVVARLRKVQNHYLAHCYQVTIENWRVLEVARRALENMARVTDSLLQMGTVGACALRGN